MTCVLPWQLLTADNQRLRAQVETLTNERGALEEKVRRRYSPTDDDCDSKSGSEDEDGGEEVDNDPE